MIARAPEDLPPGYPAELASDVLLSDGLVAELRPIAPSDAAAIEMFAGQLSDEARYLRFFSYRKALTPAELHHLVNIDYERRLALVAFVDGELVAVARYERSQPEASEAEIAFVVRDDQQGRGLGTMMLEHLASAARARGVVRFVADTLSENRKMLGVFRAAGFEEHARFEDGVIRVTLVLDGGPAYVARVDDRERVASVRSIERLLEPCSVAVIGASPRRGTVGHELVANLRAGGFAGPVFPIHPSAETVLGLAAYPTIGDAPGTVDLAVVAVPAGAVLGVLEQCGRAGVAAVVIVSSGFSETGAEGAERERQVVAMAHHYGMRVVGPNSMGILNGDPTVRLNATFSAVGLQPTAGTDGASAAGAVAWLSQAGGLGVAILEESARRDLAVAGFVSVGNKADVSGNDLIEYWGSRPEVAVMLLHLESFGNPRRFVRIARRAGRSRPIVAVKARRRSAPDAVVDALFRQAGVIRVDTLEELFDVAEVLTCQPLPRGPRVAIVANGGGPGVLAADACEGYGLELAVLAPATTARLTSVLSDGAVVSNPVDCAPWASAEEYRLALEAVLADPGVDAVIVIFTPALAFPADDVAGAVAGAVVAAATVAAATGSDIPIVANFLAATPTLGALRQGPRPIPWFPYPETAARALARIVPYARWRAEPEAKPVELTGCDSEAARRVIEQVLGAGGPGGRGGPDASAPEDGAFVSVEMDEERLRAVLAAYSIPVGDPGGPPEHPPEPLTVVTIGVVEDESFGPIVYCAPRWGHARASASPYRSDPQAVSLVPLTAPEASAVAAAAWSAAAGPEVSAEPASAAPVRALAELIRRAARLAEDLPEVVELVLDPVDCSTASARVQAARIRLARVSPPPALRRRHLA